MNSRNILVLTYWSYKDALIQTYTLPYVRIIRKVLPRKNKIFLVTFENVQRPLGIEEIKKIQKNLLSEDIRWVRLTYVPFSITAFIYAFFSITQLLALCFFQKINVIHAWCTPAGSMGYILSKITGASLIIDSYEPHAEAMAENGTWKKNSIAYKILFFFEKKMSQHAYAVIACVNTMREYARKKYKVDLKNFYVKPACVNLEQFSLANRKKIELLSQFDFENKIICVYAGKFGGIYLKNEVFDFFKAAHEYWKNKFKILLLTSHSQYEIQEYCKESNLDYTIIKQMFILHNEIADYMGLADFAITPVKPVSTKRYCSPIKNGEYWALGLPVVITPNISDDSSLISEYDAGSIIKSFDPDSCLLSVKKIDDIINSSSPGELYKKIRMMAEKYRNFTHAETVYKEIYSRNC